MKDNFQTNIKCRLINPRKTEMDQVKIRLDGINNAITIKTCVKAMEKYHLHAGIVQQSI